MRGWALLVAFAILPLAGCLSAPSAVLDPLAVFRADVVCGGVLGTFDLRSSTLAEQQRALTDGEVTSLQLVDAYIERIEAFDRAGPTLNSVRSINPTARQQAMDLDAERAAGKIRGPLHGTTTLLKDVIGTNDMPTTAGSIALELNVPPADATVVAKLRAAGVIILGKANLNEFSNWMALDMPMGHSSLGGQVVNAYTGGNPGGSSAGSGVAGSMAFSSFTIGTDTTGSVTYPSNMNSLAGLRPTHALVSHAGVIPIIPQFDAIGPMGRSVADVAAVLGAMVGVDPLDPFTAPAEGNLRPGSDYTTELRLDALDGVRLGYDEDGDTPAFAAVRQHLEALGATLVPIQVEPALLTTGAAGQIVGFAGNEFKFSINHYLAEEAGPGLPVETLADIIAFNREHPDKVKYGQEFLEVSEATPGRRELSDAAVPAVWTNSRALADALFMGNDVDALIALDGGITAYSAFTAAAGYPNMVVPAGYDGTTPLGLSFFGPRWSDHLLLGYAYAYEQATMLRRPPEVVNPTLMDLVCPAAAAAVPEA